ncbi:helix-turn-helix domain-containing protein [Halarchaeum sp. P4]|uniref:helix-turn-helix domain-containing protein n=1 Tax=Halarchaeum sp. P4 TaxID=3421639 RepID=UPI003EBE43C0
MPRAELTVSVPEGIWIGDVSRRFPAATFRVVTAFADDETGVGLVEIGGDDPATVLRDVGGHETILDHTVLYETPEEVLVQFETAEPLLLLPLRESGIPLEFPFEIRDGDATWTLRAPTEQLGALRDQFSAFGISFTLERLGAEDSLETDSLLTERQRDVLATAVEAGFYETPRRCTLTDVADELGIAKSTCSETLHRAEATVISEFADRTALLEEHQ